MIAMRQRITTNLLGWSILISTFVLWVDIGEPLITILSNPFGVGFAVVYFAYLIGWAGYSLKKVFGWWQGPPPPPPAVEVFEYHTGNYREPARVRHVSALLEAASKIAGPDEGKKITLEQLRNDFAKLRSVILIVNAAPACCDSPSCLSSSGEDASSR